jgi:hypothetical protein
MRIKLRTLIDITDTNARFDKSNPDWHRKQNYMTLIQTISMRANPIIEKSPKVSKHNISNMSFGSDFKGLHNVWELDFHTDYAEINITDLESDIDFFGSTFERTNENEAC